jgi:hypothetical protein
MFNVERGLLFGAISGSASFGYDVAENGLSSALEFSSLTTDAIIALVVGSLGMLTKSKQS